MKAFIIILVCLCAAHAFRTGDFTAFTVSLVLAQALYGKQVYRLWCRTFNR